MARDDVKMLFDARPAQAEGKDEQQFRERYAQRHDSGGRGKGSRPIQSVRVSKHRTEDEQDLIRDKKAPLQAPHYDCGGVWTKAANRLALRSGTFGGASSSGPISISEF